MFDYNGNSYTVKYNRETGNYSIITINNGYKVEEPPTISHCSQCKYAVEVSTRLYSCDGDHEVVVYCQHHDVICKSLRKACEWAVIADS